MSETFLDTEMRSEEYTEVLAERFITAQRILAEVSNDIDEAVRNKSNV